MMIRPALDPASETDGARLKVRDPMTMQFLADDGAENPVSEYWLRRIVEGSVEQQVDGKWPEPKMAASADDHKTRLAILAGDEPQPATHEETAP